MILLIGFLTFVLVMNCLFLMLLILIQLPKKEAGAGIAFGAGATDALFGAGSGNALTKMTKYSASFFVGLSVLLSVLNIRAHNAHTLRLQRELQKPSASPVATAPVVPKQDLNTLQTQPAPSTTNLISPSAATGAAPAKLMTTITNQGAAPSTPAAAPQAEAPAPKPAPPPK
jgi:preprotein translocase subunit SecG